jgi:hypothetical protein
MQTEPTVEQAPAQQRRRVGAECITPQACHHAVLPVCGCTGWSELPLTSCAMLGRLLRLLTPLCMRLWPGRRCASMRREAGPAGSAAADSAVRKGMQSEANISLARRALRLQYHSGRKVQVGSMY